MQGGFYQNKNLHENPYKGGFFIETETFTPKQIYDRIFKRIFFLSDIAVINLINGLFDSNFPLNSTVFYPSRESVTSNLESRYADMFLTIANHTFHLEAQSTDDTRITLRVFEYSFLQASSAHPDSDILTFPEPMIIYLNQPKDLPNESILHLAFTGQGTFDYRIKNFVYLDHRLTELDKRNLAAFIPFQLLRLRDLLDLLRPNTSPEKSALILKNFSRLQAEIWHDIIKSMEHHLRLGNLTEDDTIHLLDLASMLYQYFYNSLSNKMKGEMQNMKPIPPGILELPHDKYLRYTDELKKEIARYADENAKYADKISKYADENAKYADEILRLKQRIAELEAVRPND